MNQNPLENKKPKSEQLAVRIELATPREWKEFKKLRLEAIDGPDAVMFGVDTPEKLAQEKERTDLQWQEELLVSKDRFTFLARVDKEPVAMGRAKKIKDSQDWRIFSGYVVEGFRGQGLQKQIIARRLINIINRGGQRVSLGVKASNKYSIANAEFFGFKKVEEGSSDMGFDMQLENVNDPEVIRKINEVLNAG